MRHAQIRRTLAKDLAATLRQNHLPVTLKSYQRETLESTVRWLERPRSQRRAYVSQATGLGKTVEFATIVRACKKLHVLVIVSGKTLVSQTVKTLANFTEGTLAHASGLRTITDPSGEVIATHWKGHQHDVLVATDETFKMQTDKIKHELDPHVIIWDECHWAYSEKAQVALDQFPEAVVVGFSATPDYLSTVAKSTYAPVELDNGQVLYGPPEKFARTYFPHCLDERTVRWGIENDYLAPLAWGQLDFKLSLDDVRVVEGLGGMDYDQAELQRVLEKNWPFMIKTIVKLYKSGQYNLVNRYTAAVCPGVKQAYQITNALKAIGISAECITGETPDHERERILQAGNEGKLQFLASVFALREGWDAPNVEVAMMLRPTKSRVFYMQFMGRVLRKFGKKVALVLDPHFQNTRFAPLSAPVLFGLPGQEVRGGDFLIRPKRRRRGTPPISPYILEQLQPVLVVEKVEVERWASEDGTFEADGEIWSSLRGLSSTLKLSKQTILKRLEGCRSRTEKASRGQSCVCYVVTEATAACSDLLELPQADNNGIFQADDEIWGTVYSLAKIAGISEAIIASRTEGCRVREGKDRSGRRTNFYTLSDIEKTCTDLLRGLPQVNNSGIVEIEKELWGTHQALAKLVEVSRSGTTKRLAQCREKEGVGSSGRVIKLYALSDYKKACADMTDSPQANADGILNIEGEEWATQQVLGKLLGISASSVRYASPCRTQKARIVTGQIYMFYAVDDVKRACAHLLKEIPRADQNGFFEEEGEIWGTVEAIARAFEGKVSVHPLRIRSSQCRKREGVGRQGRVVTFYSLSDMKKACADLLARHGTKPNKRE